jgi:hypothetical protein
VKRQESSHGVLIELTWKGIFQQHNILCKTNESLASVRETDPLPKLITS